MKGYTMLRIGEARWIEKEDPKCGSMDTICRSIVLAPCSFGIHTAYEGGVGECHNVMFGHEAVGEVVEVGSTIKDFRVGGQVIIPAITPDWSSMAAQESYTMYSGVPLDDWKFSNIKGGVFVELIHTNDANGSLAHLSEGISPEVGAMLSDMVTTGLHRAELAGIEPDDVVAVIGIGLIDLMPMVSAFVLDAGRPFAVGSRPKCAGVAQEFGATGIISYREDGIVEQIMKTVRGQGINRVVVAGGDLDAFQQAFGILKVGGRVADVNYLGEGENIKTSRGPTMVGMGHKHLVGGLTPGGRNRMDKIANLVLAGRIHPKKIIAHRFTGIEHVKDGAELMRTKSHDPIKSVIPV